MPQTAAGVTGEASLLQGTGCRIGGTSLNQATTEDDDPHLKVGRLLDEDVLLRGEEPEQVAAAYLIMTAAQQIGSAAARNEVQLQLRMAVAAVGTCRVGITPRHSVEACGKFESLQHGDKK